LVQFALIVVCWPTAGEAGFAVGVHVGTVPPPVTQVTVCVGDVPETTKLLQLGFVYVKVAAFGLGDNAISTAAEPSMHQRTSVCAEAHRLLSDIKLSLPRALPREENLLISIRGAGSPRRTRCAVVLLRICVLVSQCPCPLPARRGLIMTLA